MGNIVQWAREWVRTRQPSRPVAEQDVTYWQERVLTVALVFGIAAGTLSVIPGVWRAYLEANWLLLIADIAVLFLALAVLLPRGVPYRIRAGTLIAAALAIGALQLHLSGLHSTGPLWLLAAPILASILFDLRPALSLVALVALLLVGYALLPVRGWVAPDVAADIGSPRWNETATDLIMLSAIIVLFIGVLLRGLRTSFDRLQALSQDLEEERGRLLRTNEELEQEVERRRQAEAERRALEDRLRQSQKMQAIGTFAGGIAHDFNNLLVPILGSAEMLKGDVPESARDHVDDIARSAQRARDLVAQILAFSRGGDSERGPVRLDRVIEETDRLLRASLPARIRLEYRLEAEGRVRWTAAAAQQVILNLATNAFHAMPDQGGRLLIRLESIASSSIDLRAGVATGAPQDDSEYVRLTVADTGVGMDSATLARVFEPFFTTRIGAEGTGLGLAMVHGLVQAAGGFILADSQPGVGTTMQVLLPRLRHGAGAKEQPGTPAPTGSGQRVLVVDDEEAVLRITGRLLERLGYRVCLAPGPDEALRLLGEQPDISLLFTDYSMPAATGIELGRAARRLRPDLPMILSSGLLEADTRESARQTGFSRLLAKPFGRDELAVALEDALGS